MFADFNGQIKLRTKQKFKFLSATVHPSQSIAFWVEHYHKMPILITCNNIFEKQVISLAWKKTCHYGYAIFFICLYVSTCQTRSYDFWIMNAMCMFVYLFVIFFHLLLSSQQASVAMWTILISKSWWWRPAPKRSTSTFIIIIIMSCC